MGWWQITKTPVRSPGATGMLWGDELADIMDGALDQIKAAYQREWGRPVTRSELEAGFQFSLGGDPR